MDSLIERFAQKHRLRLRRSDDRLLIIRGRHGFLYDYDDGQRLGLTISSEDGGAGRWNNRRRAGEVAGMECIQDGDAEGTLLFDPSDAKQARVAIKAVAAHRQRRLSPEQRVAASAHLAKLRADRLTSA